MDISERVLTDASEAGLYDISFHPSEKYFLLSYANKLNDLVVEKFQFNLDGGTASSAEADKIASNGKKPKMLRRYF